ncbi:MAG: glycosyltransferase family 39 protein [Anaerolineae bacterium]|nr:glycosyltransferase family 39 protein [Anaerolineae bacterium]
MRKPRSIPFLWSMIPLLLVAAALRWGGVAWDGGIGAHPDERYVVGIAEEMGRTGQMDPFGLDPHFSYGHLPLYLLALLGGEDRLFAARLLAGLFDSGTVALAAALGRRLGGPRTGLLSGAFLAVMPLHVQQAHFGVVDPFLAFFSSGSILFAVRSAGSGRCGAAILAGAWAGLAASCKASALLLVLPLAAAWAIAPVSGTRRAARGLVTAGAALAAFAAAAPFVLLRLPTFAAALAEQSALVRGAALAPYTLQYHDTAPYLYPLGQLLAWGMGPVMGLLGLAGAGAAVWQAAKGPLAAAEWVVLAWCIPFLAFVGGLFVKLPRYMLPLTPLLAVYGARAGEWLLNRRRWLGGTAAALSLLPGGVISLALIVSYNTPHPWVTTTAWVRENVPPGSTIAVEAWDHPLPLDPSGYQIYALPVLDPETAEKWAVIDRVLEETDVMIIASRRGYGALANWPQRFPLAAAYYQELFSGERGFQVAACFERWPRLGPLPLADDPLRAAGLVLPAPACHPAAPFPPLPPLDESFVVYDHPLVIVMQRPVATCTAQAVKLKPRR